MRDHDGAPRETPTRRRRPRWRARPPRRSTARDADRDAHEGEEGRLRQRGEMLGLEVTVEVRRVGRLAREAHREEGQQRCDEVGAAVRRFGDEGEAPRCQAGRELDRDQHTGCDDRRKGGAPLRRHCHRAKAIRPVPWAPRGGARPGSRRRSARRLRPGAPSASPRGARTAKTAATNGCRFVASVARDGPMRSSERNQSTFVTTSGPSVANRSSAHTSQPRLQSCEDVCRQPVSVSGTQVPHEHDGADRATASSGASAA